MRKLARCLRRGAVISLVAVALLVFASPAAVAGRTDSAGKTVTVEVANVAVRYPSSWTRYPLTEKTLAAQQRRVAEKSPLFALSPAQQKCLLKRAAFYASDLDTARPGRPLSSVSVREFTRGRFPSSLEEFRSGRTSRFEAAGVTILDTSAVRTSGKPSYRIEVLLSVKAPDGTPGEVRIGQLLVPHRRGGTVITVKVPADDAAAQFVDDVLGSARRV